MASRHLHVEPLEERTMLSLDLAGDAWYVWREPGPDGAPVDECLGTSFQCLAERGGLAATDWALYAEQGSNLFSPQFPLPMKAATPAEPHVFMVDDTNNKVTETDTGFNWGIELDAVTVSFERPLEMGTSTIYGAASSILHSPDAPIRSLWASYQQGPLHPRFGFADAFNLDVHDALTGLIDPDGEKILRTAGPGAHFDGFAIDHDPMLAMIDNYLEDNFIPGLFMSDPNIARALNLVNDRDHPDAPFLGWNYVSYNSGDLPVTTSWVPQDYGGSDGLSNLQIATVTRTGQEDGVLRADAALFRDGPGDKDPHRDGEMYVDLRYRYHHPLADAQRPVECGSPPRDLTDAVITAEVRLGPGLLGDPSPPAAFNGIQVFLKSVSVDDQDNENWHNYYGPWVNTTSNWQTLTLHVATDTPAERDAQFDLSQVGLLGIKVGTNSQVTGVFEDSVEVAFVRIDYPDGSSSQWDFENTDDSITRMAKTGANTVALVDHWFVDSLTSTDIRQDPDVTQQYLGSPTTAIADTIQRLHDAGLAVHLKPHLDVAKFNYGKDEWRGQIRPSAENLDAFFASYEQFILFYAQIAAASGAEGLVVETELNALDTDASLAAYWADIVEAIREVYRGDLIVAANWDSFQDNTLAAMVDIVGIDAYFPLTEALNPTREDLVAAWENSRAAGYVGTDWAGTIAAWSETLGKPFYFTEFGIQCRSGAAAAPGSDCKSPDTARYNAALQVNHFEAALDVFSQNKQFSGLLGWAWFPWSDAGGVGDLDFTPQNKPLESAAPRLFRPPQWQNAYAPEDVDDSGNVMPLDVLILINYINHQPNNASLPIPPESPPPYYDVTGDGFCTALDVLTVISYINARSAKSGEGEATFLADGPPLWQATAASQQVRAASPGESLTRQSTTDADSLVPPRAADALMVPFRPALSTEPMDFLLDDGEDLWLGNLESILPDIAEAIDQ